MTTLRFGLLVCIAVLGTQSLKAEELSIVDVRRHITLADDDIVYKDFYLNGGEGDGLKKNLVVTAIRKIQVRDSSGSQGYGEIQVPVGQLRIIAIYGKIAVAREYKLLSRDELPMLEQTGLMSGDRIDLKGAFVDNAKPKYTKKKVASSNTTAPVLVATLTTSGSGVTGTPGPSNIAVTSPAPKGPAPASVKAAAANPPKPDAPNTTNEAVAAANPPPAPEKTATATATEAP